MRGASNRAKAEGRERPFFLAILQGEHGLVRVEACPNLAAASMPGQKAPRFHAAAQVRPGLGRCAEEAARKRLAGQEAAGGWYHATPQEAAQAAREAVEEVTAQYVPGTTLAHLLDALGLAAEDLARLSGLRLPEVARALSAADFWPSQGLSAMAAIRRGLEAAGVSFLPPLAPA